FAAADQNGLVLPDRLGAVMQDGFEFAPLDHLLPVLADEPFHEVGGAAEEPVAGRVRRAHDEFRFRIRREHLDLLDAIVAFHDDLVAAVIADDALGLAARQLDWRHGLGIVDAAGDDRAIRITLDELHDHFLANVGNEHAAPFGPAPVL